jgi:hypothetical protein
MGSLDRPELVRVGRRNGWRPAVVAILAIAIVLAVALWKPWAAAPAAGRIVAESPGATPGNETHRPEPTPRPSRVTFAGLDLASMGTADPHPSWGVAVAYVSQRQFDLAQERGASTVTPVVSWELNEPGRPGPGSRLDHPDVTTVAIAATWPRGTLPRAIRLFYTPADGAAGRQEILLERSLARIVRNAPVDASELSVGSGDFFLRPATVASRPADWLRNGWPAGAYVLEVEVERGPGVRVALQFTLGGAPSG